MAHSLIPEAGRRSQQDGVDTGIHFDDRGTGRVNTVNDDGLEEGRVNKVRQEFQVHEDGAVAHQMQNREFEDHFGFNRFQRRTTREGIQVAKVVQSEEERTAQIKRMEQLEQSKQIEDSDRELAKEYQDYLALEQKRKKAEEDRRIAKEVMEQLAREEDMIQTDQTAQDEEMAKQLQDKEKAKYERYQQKKRAKELRREREKIEAQIAREAEVLNRAKARPDGMQEDTGDFSDFYIQPHPDMDAEEHKELQELQDEELARLIQDQEHKRGAVVHKEKLKQIEEQDAELARIIQEQERIKLRKAREKHRQKSLQQPQPQSNVRDEPEFQTDEPPTRSKSFPAQNQRTTTDRPTSPSDRENTQHHTGHSSDRHFRESPSNHSDPVTRQANHTDNVSRFSSHETYAIDDVVNHVSDSVNHVSDSVNHVSDSVERPISWSPVQGDRHMFGSGNRSHSSNSGSYHSRQSNDSRSGDRSLGGLPVERGPHRNRAESYSSDEGSIPYRHPPAVTAPKGQTFNIAAAIDPTFNRNKHRHPSQGRGSGTGRDDDGVGDDPTFITAHISPDQTAVKENSVGLQRGAIPPTATLMRTGYIQEHWNPIPAQVAGDDGYWNEEEEIFTGPIQGHRRTNSGRKSKSKKDKEKDRKSGCKQQ